MTELLLGRAWTACSAAWLAAAALSGCVKTTDGTAAWAGQSAKSVATQSAPSTAVPGIETTLPDHIPPDAFACLPKFSGTGVGTVAQVSDPAAPRITITRPDDWSGEPGQRDVALTLAGPDGLSGEVTIAATTLDPAAAFAEYAAMLVRSKPDLHVDTVGAPFCGYSSQKLTGTYLGPPGALDFADRITHIWTNADKYLVTLHLEGPADAPAFNAAKTALMQDFAVVIP